MSASSKYTYNFGPPKNVLKKNLFVSLSGRPTDRHTERLILYQLIHWPQRLGLGLARPKPEPWSNIRFSQVCGRKPSIPASGVFPDTLAGSWTGSGGAGTQGSCPTWNTSLRKGILIHHTHYLQLEYLV